MTVAEEVDGIDEIENSKSWVFGGLRTPNVPEKGFDGRCGGKLWSAVWGFIDE